MNTITLTAELWDEVVESLLCKIQTNTKAMGMINDSGAKYCLQEQNNRLNRIIQMINNEIVNN